MEKTLKNTKKKNDKEHANIISPSQLDPDPSYPVLHVHSKEPSVLVHSALSSQLSVPFSHSSISVEVAESV